MFNLAPRCAFVRAKRALPLVQLARLCDEAPLGGRVGAAFSKMRSALSLSRKGIWPEACSPRPGNRRWWQGAQYNHVSPGLAWRWCSLDFQGGASTWSGSRLTLFVEASQENTDGSISAKKHGAQRSRNGGCASSPALRPLTFLGLATCLLPWPLFMAPYNSRPRCEHMPSNTGRYPTCWPLRYQPMAPIILSSEVHAFPSPSQVTHCLCQSTVPRSASNLVTTSAAVRPW